MKRRAAILATLLLTMASWGFSSTYRCNSNLVSVGDRAYEVEQKCGAPKSKQVIGKTKYKERLETRTVLIEEWVYELRYGWADILTFTGGKLSEITSVRK